MENQPLVLDLLEWLSQRPRPYDEVIDTWRTSCPRLTVWEDTLDAGLVRMKFDDEHGKLIAVTPAGRDFLRSAGRS